MLAVVRMLFARSRDVEVVGFGVAGGVYLARPLNVALPKANIPPSEPISQYPAPETVEAMPTTGALSGWPPIDPKNFASPNAKIPPSDATSQYPAPDDVAAAPTIGLFSDFPPIEP